jgi:hypothetical protein
MIETRGYGWLPWFPSAKLLSDGFSILLLTQLILQSFLLFKLTLVRGKTSRNIKGVTPHVLSNFAFITGHDLVF